MPDIEFEFWTQKPERAPTSLREVIKECHRHILPVVHGLQSDTNGQEIAPGMFAGAALGQTYGHSALRLENRGESLLHLEDKAVQCNRCFERMFLVAC